MRKVTYEEKPVEEFLKEEKAKEALKERDAATNNLKMSIRRGIKEKYPVSKGKSGLARTFSDEEIFMLDQKQMAEKIINNGHDIKCDARSKKKMLRLLKYVATCISSDGYFSPSEHAKRRPDEFMNFMGDTINAKTKFPYYTATMYQDLKSLEKLGHIYSKGTSGNLVYYLGKRERKIPEPKIEQPQVTSAQYDPISQKIYIDIVVRVHTETV